MRILVFSLLALMLTALPVRANFWNKEYDISAVFHQLYSLSAWRDYESVDVYLTPDSVSFHIKDDPEKKMKFFGEYRKVRKNTYYFDSTRYQASGAFNERGGFIVCRFLEIEINPSLTDRNILKLMITHHKSEKQLMNGNFCSGWGYHPVGPPAIK